MINVSKLEKGIVLDHITQGQGYKIFEQLGLDKLDDVVVLMRNVESAKMGKKDIIKIETDLPLDMDVLGLLDPGITVTYVRNGERTQKIKLALPKKVTGIIKCKNPRCISNQEHIEDVTFTLVNAEQKLYACEYCDARSTL